MNRTPKKTVAFSAIVIGIFFLLSSTLVSANFVFPPRAVYGTIYIKADGSVSPGNAPISRSGNVYRLTDKG